MLSRNAKGNASYILEETRGSFASRPPIQPKIRAIVLFRNGRLSTPKVPRGVHIGKHQQNLRKTFHYGALLSILTGTKNATTPPRMNPDGR